MTVAGPFPPSPGAGRRVSHLGSACRLQLAAGVFRVEGNGLFCCRFCALDQSPSRDITPSFENHAAPGINAILAADFLNTQQKADILCRNAQRFLRLSESICSD
jgi:hypothetical protein